MSLKSAPYYWAECDYPDCGVSAQEDSDYAAWADEGQAITSALDDGWVHTDDGRDFCEAHTVWDDETDDRVPMALPTAVAVDA